MTLFQISSKISSPKFFELKIFPIYLHQRLLQSDEGGHKTPHHFSTILVLIGVVCAILGVLISTYSIRLHLKHYVRPRVQRSIVRLLLFVPIYSVFSILILLLPSIYIYLEVGRSIWEAIVIYSFFNLILEYCGGESVCATLLADDPGLLRHPKPFCWIINIIGFKSSGTFRVLNEYIPMDDYFIKFCKRCLLLFILLNPIISIATVIIHSVGIGYSIIFTAIHQIFYNIAIFIALYALVIFYLATRNLLDLRSKQPIWKFLSIKLIIALTWYQTMILYIIYGFEDKNVAHISNWIQCLELPIFAIVQGYAFSAEEFKKDNSANQMNKYISVPPIGLPSEFPNYIQASDSDNKESHVHKAKELNNQDFSENTLQNAKDAVYLKDVVSDAYYHFSSKYNKHSLLIDSDDDETRPNVKEVVVKSNKPSSIIIREDGSIFK